MKPILVPTDFSEVSIQAARYALTLAAEWGSDLILVHVQPLPLVISDIPLPYENYELSLEEANLKMNDLTTRLQAKLPAGLRCSGQVLSGDFIHQMKGLIREKKPLLIVMGKQGAGATETFFMGSHARSAVRLEWPLLVVPQNAVFHPIRDVVFACDMKKVKETVPFHAIRAFLDLFKAKLNVLHIADSESKDPALLSESEYLRNELNLSDPEIHVVHRDSISAGFAGFIRDHKSDLLLLVPKKHGVWGSLFHSSVTTQTLLHPVIPLLMLPGQS